MMEESRASFCASLLLLLSFDFYFFEVEILLVTVEALS